MADIVIDPEFQSLLMPLTAEEYAQLERNILEEGCREPLLLWQVEPEKDSHKCYYDPAIIGGDYDYGDGPCRTEDVLIPEDGVWHCEACDHNPALLEATLIDGHNRYEICTKHGVEFEVEYLDFENRKEAHDWIINNQLGRRNVTPEQASYLRGRRYLSEKLNVGRQEHILGQNVHINRTAEKLGQEYKVDEKTIRRDAEYAFALDTIGLIAGEETKRDILAGNTKLTKQDVIAIQEMPPARQIKTIEMIQNGAKSGRDAIRLARRAEVAETSKFPTGKYRVIYADPPWKYGDGLTANYGAAEYHYPPQTITELCEKFPVADLAEDNAVLFLWVTSPLLEECFPLIKAWGFKYKASFVWDKVKHNMGHYNSVRHEFLLVCTRGSCTPDVSKLYDSVQSIERTEHSEKPEEFRQIIDMLYPHGARLELFARKQAEGWEVYGNQFKGTGL